MASNDTEESLECVRRYIVDAGQNSTKTYYFYSGYSGIPENLTLNIIVWLIMFAIFLVVRWIRIFREKRDVTEGGRNILGLYTHFQDVFGWIPELFKKGDEDFSTKCGWDAVIYLRFQRYLMFLMAGAGLLSLCVALPVNFQDDLGNILKKLNNLLLFWGRNYQNYNIETLQANLDNIKWTLFDGIEDPQLAWDQLLDDITRVVDQLYPIKKFNIYKQKEAWINDELMHLIIEKDQLLKDASLRNDEESWKIARQARNRVKNYIFRAKTNYIKGQLAEHKGNTKSFWRNVNKILPGNKNMSNDIALKDENGEIISPECTADYINNFFANIGPKLAEKYTAPYEFVGPIGQGKFEFQQFEVQEVHEELKKINIAKSSCVNLLSTKILKDIFIHIRHKLTNLFDKCLNAGKFPDTWKHAIVAPLKKEGFKANVSDVRPVSGLPLPVTDFGKTTIANVDGNSDLIWIHVILAAVYLAVTIFMMKRFTKLYVKGRAPTEINRTLLVSHVPCHAVTRDDIYTYFTKRFGEAKIETINFSYRVKEVNAVQEKRKYTLRLREEAIEMDNRTGEKDMMKPYPCACFCCCCRPCQRVETAGWCVEQDAKLKAEYEKKARKALRDPLDIVFISFYTENMAIRVYNAFNKVWRMHCVCRARCCPQTELDGSNWIVYYSPRHDDIYWQNLGAHDIWWWLKAAVLNIALLFFLFVFTTPSVFMNLLDEWRYKDAIQGLKSPLIVNVIPVLLLCVFSSLLPLIVYFSELLIGHWKRTIEEKLIMQKTFALLLLMILILPSLGLTSAKALLMWFADQKGAMRSFRWKCVFLPDNGAFFVNYVITAAFMGTGLQLLRVGDLIVFSIKLLLARSPAERQLVRKMEGTPFPYGQQYAWVGVIVAVVMSYSVTCPLVVPFGLAYLVMKHLVDRHNLYFVAKPVRLGGQMHARAVIFINTGVILLQVWMIMFTAIRSDELPPTSAFSLAVLVLALGYLTGNAMYAWVKHQIARMKLVFTDEDPQLSSLNDAATASVGAARYRYIPEVLLSGTVDPSTVVSSYPLGGASVA